MYLNDLLGDAFHEGMSAEEISNALQAAGIGASAGADDATGRLKELLNKANSDVAKYKKALKEKQTAEETAAQEQRELLESLQSENQRLRTDMERTNLIAKFVGQGYSADLALETATAYMEGDIDKVLANQSKYTESKVKQAQADFVKNTPHPNGGASGGSEPTDYQALLKDAIDRHDFTAMAQLTRLAEEQARSGSHD